MTDQAGRGMRGVPEDLPAFPMTPVTELQHLLKVAGSISHDAEQAWAEVWAELRQGAAGDGTPSPDAPPGFVPRCGWPDFIDKFWAIKFYLDSVQRICGGERRPISGRLK
jgi:hypothetical protein